MQKPTRLLALVASGVLLTLAIGCSHEPRQMAMTQPQCTKQDTEACVTLSQQIVNKAIKTNNVTEREGLFADATQMLINGCEWGNPSACYALGMTYEIGKYQLKDTKAAERYYKAACSKELTVACASLGEVYINQKQPKQAMQVFKESCDKYNDQKACKTYSDLQKGKKHVSYFME